MGCNFFYVKVSSQFMMKVPIELSVARTETKRYNTSNRGHTHTRARAEARFKHHESQGPVTSVTLSSLNDGSVELHTDMVLLDLPPN